MSLTLEKKTERHRDTIPLYLILEILDLIEKQAMQWLVQCVALLSDPIKIQ